jgi:hypothetical protein
MILSLNLHYWWVVDLSGSQFGRSRCIDSTAVILGWKDHGLGHHRCDDFVLIEKHRLLVGFILHLHLVFFQEECAQM